MTAELRSFDEAAAAFSKPPLIKAVAYVVSLSASSNVLSVVFDADAVLPPGAATHLCASACASVTVHLHPCARDRMICVFAVCWSAPT